MTAHAVAPTHSGNEPATRQASGTAERLSEHWRQQLEELLEPTLATIQRQVVEVAAAQLAPSRSQQEVGRQRQASESAGVAPLQSAGASALAQWGGALGEWALITLAVGEILDGVATLLQAVDERFPANQAPSAQRKGPAREEGHEGGGESPFQRFGHAVAEIALSLREMVSRRLGGASNLVERMEGALDSLPQWGRVLGHASELLHALNEMREKSYDELSGSSSWQKWEPIIKHGAPLVKELGQALGGLSSQESQIDLENEHGDGAPGLGGMLGRASSALGELGQGSKSKQGGDDSGESDSEGESSDEKDKGNDDSPLDKLIGKNSPLQGLREFSKRQEGPGGLAPQGPLGRKPPSGPLRRDRIEGMVARERRENKG